MASTNRRRTRQQSLQERAGLTYRPSEFAERVLHAIVRLWPIIDTLSPAEQNFIDGVATYMRTQPPTFKQTEIVEQIADRHAPKTRRNVA